LVLGRVASAVCLLVALVSLGATAAAAQISLQVTDPAAVISAYETARNRGDVDSALSYFADDATVSQRNSTLSGKEEIRRYLQGITGRGRFVVVANRRVNGNQLSWTERPSGQNVNGFEIAVEAIVQDGMIKALSYNGAASVPRQEPSLDGRAQLPALLGLGSVLLVLSGVVLVASTGVGRPRAGASSSLRGRLMQDLQVWRSARGTNG
jgi:hypothetical protein